MKRIVCALLVLVGLGSMSQPVSAAPIAVFGNNGSGAYLSSLGHTVTQVTDAQLATAGFLNSFSAFYYTRDGFSFGSGLSVAAAANVSAYVGATGSVVLFNGDFADSFPGGETATNQLYANAAAFATASGHGFIGEFNGAVAALTSNSDGFNPLNLITGSAGPLGGSNGGSSGSVILDPNGVGHPVLTGVILPYNPSAVEYGSTLTGVSNLNVIARFDNGNPAILVRSAAIAEVPEPATVAVFGGIAVAGLFGYRRRKSAPTTAA